MYEIKLAEPSKELETAAMDYRQEHIVHNEKINGSCGFINYANYDEWLEKVNQAKNAETSQLKVPASTYFSVRKSDNKIIGTIQLRHRLTDELEKHGGHIGYSIRPSERQKGYGKQQLLLVLEIAKQMKIPKVMISCYKDNIASSRTAISCGGILALENVYEDKLQQTFWIYLEN